MSILSFLETVCGESLLTAFCILARWSGSRDAVSKQLPDVRNDTPVYGPAGVA